MRGCREKTEIRELLGTRRLSSRNRCDQEKQGHRGSNEGSGPITGGNKRPQELRIAYLNRMATVGPWKVQNQRSTVNKWLVAG